MKPEPKVSKKSAAPIVVSYGAGTNSTAMLIEMRDREIKPALILFADTGGERPETYELIERMSERCQKWFGTEVAIVRRLFAGNFEGLAGENMRLKNLPALAYGRRGCSMKYKVEPQNREVRRWMKLHKVDHVIRAIGFDTSENYRAFRIVKAPEKWETKWFPLIEMENVARRLQKEMRSGRILYDSEIFVLFLSSDETRRDFGITKNES